MKANCTLLYFVMILLVFSFTATAFAAEWAGVDEAVVEKYAAAHGREARKPLINTGQGDLRLFVFLFAGMVGGFAAGYYWRALFTEKGLKDRLQNEA